MLTPLTRREQLVSIARLPRSNRYRNAQYIASETNIKNVTVLSSIIERLKKHPVLYNLLVKPVVVEDGLVVLDTTQYLPIGLQIYARVSSFKHIYKNQLLFNIVCNAITLVVAIGFLRNFLIEFREYRREEVVAWIDHFNDSWIPILHYILKSGFFNDDDRSLIAGAYLPYKAMLKIADSYYGSHAGILGQSQIVGRINSLKKYTTSNKRSAFSRSILNMITIFAVFVLAFKGVGKLVPLEILPDFLGVGNTKVFNSIFNAKRSINQLPDSWYLDNQGIISLQWARSIWGYETEGDKAVKAARLFMEGLMPQVTTIIFTAGVKLVWNSYTILFEEIKKRKRTN